MHVVQLHSEDVAKLHGGACSHTARRLIRRCQCRNWSLTAPHPAEMAATMKVNADEPDVALSFAHLVRSVPSRPDDLSTHSPVYRAHRLCRQCKLLL